jgi:hypothetical protein
MPPSFWERKGTTTFLIPPNFFESFFKLFLTNFLSIQLNSFVPLPLSLVVSSESGRKGTFGKSD